ncbi:MAG: diaminopimelate epimerase [Gammaproteobacteria bacterium]|nr:diaminopimelate epimerase [Gammaproteobacteria bacterium]
MSIRFSKMHGLGNDFVIIDLISQTWEIRTENVIKLSDRKTGIGFDQLLTVSPPKNPELDFLYRIYNADGSEAEQCGNGARCLLKFVLDHRLTFKKKIRLETKRRPITCVLEDNGQITVDMGEPQFKPKQIPQLADTEEEYYLELKEIEKRLVLTTVNLGNPHAVIEVTEIENYPVEKYGSIVSTHSTFPEGINVGFMEVVSSDRIKLRVFERGVGETSSCGTAACAAVASGIKRGKLKPEVVVDQIGGELKIKWFGSESPLMMTGPASNVYEGEIDI